MKKVILDLPTFAFVVSTRAALGAGIGLLLSEKVPATRRRRIGATLFAIGAATTIPAAMSVIRSVRRAGATSRVDCDERLVGATRFARKGDDDVV